MRREQEQVGTWQEQKLGRAGEVKKKRGMEEGSERSFSDPRLFFSHYHCVFFLTIFLLFPYPPLFQHLSSPSFPLSFSSILPSFIILKVIYSIPSTCPLFLFFSFAFGMVRDVLPVIPPLYHLSHPVPERKRERGAERRGGRKRKRGAGVGGGG